MDTPEPGASPSTEPAADHDPEDYLDPFDPHFDPAAADGKRPLILSAFATYRPRARDSVAFQIRVALLVQQK